MLYREDDSHVTNTDCFLRELVKAHEQVFVEETVSGSAVHALDFLTTFSSSSFLALPKCQTLF